MEVKIHASLPRHELLERLLNNNNNEGFGRKYEAVVVLVMLDVASIYEK